MKQSLNPRRRPKVGGYARGDETRAHILAQAVKIFGEHGYDRTSTRDIAAKADVKPPALQYYFGGKEGLHRACARLVVDRALIVLSPALEAAARAIDDAQVAGATAALLGLVDALIDLVTVKSSASLSRFFHRAKREGSGPGVDLFRDKLSSPVATVVEGLLIVITGAASSSDETRARALLLLSQIYAIQIGRENFLGSLCWRKLNSDKVAIIKRQIHEHVGAMFINARPSV